MLMVMYYKCSFIGGGTKLTSLNSFNDTIIKSSPYWIALINKDCLTPYVGCYKFKQR